MKKWSDIILSFLELIFKKKITDEDMEPKEIDIPVPQETVPVNSNATQLYLAGKASLGKRLTLNSAVPINLGCAQAVSKLLYQVKFTAIPKHGIDGTAGLLKWCEENPLLFEKLDEPEKGAIIIYATGSGNGRVRGHTGVLGELGKMYPDDYAVMSNNSVSGLWDTQWSLKRMQDYYGVYGELPVSYFRLK